MYQRILIPTDGSPCARIAIDEGLQLAKRLGAEVTFLHVLENPFTSGYVVPELSSYAPQVYEDLKKAAAEVLEQAQRLAEEVGVTAKTVLLEHRDPVQAIHDTEADHDLVVMGTHGRRGFNRWMFGSVAEGALRRSEKPFLVIRAQSGESS